jgi:hypothetical protein
VTANKHLTSTKAGKALLSLLVLAVLAVTLQTLVFSDAKFTTASSSASNVWASGTLTQTNSMADQVVVNGADLRPGQTATGTLTITGGGDGSGAYTLAKANLIDTPASPGLSNTMQLLIQDITSGSTTIYTGTVAAFTSSSLGTIAPGVAKTYRVTLTYPSSATANLQGAALSLTLQFTGVSQ